MSGEWKGKGKGQEERRGVMSFSQGRSEMLPLRPKKGRGHQSFRGKKKGIIEVAGCHGGKETPIIFSCPKEEATRRGGKFNDHGIATKSKTPSTISR